MGAFFYLSDYNMPKCLLCNSDSTRFYKEQYYQCTNCKGIFRPIERLPTLEKEKARYDKHNNDTADEGYRNFVSPITNAIMDNHKIEDMGLDFGAGSGPIIAETLKNKGYEPYLFDPIYHKNYALLENKYDYIYACEVIEHFHKPYDEFSLLYNLLNNIGKLYCMTHLYNESIDFDRWYYKNDFTHVFIYTQETIDWIAAEIGFSDYKIDDRLITFWK